MSLGRFYLTHVCTIGKTAGVLMVGKTAEGSSVGVLVKCYRPYVYTLETANSDVVQSSLNEAYRDDVKRGQLVHRSEVEMRTPLIGFSKGAKHRLVKWYLKDTMAYTARTFAFMRETTGVEIYHDDWDIASLFLNEFDIGLYSWVEVEGCVRNHGKLLTSCRQEYQMSRPSPHIRPLMRADAAPTPSLTVVYCEFKGASIYAEGKVHTASEFQVFLLAGDTDIVVYASESGISKEVEGNYGRVLSGSKTVGRDFVNLVDLFQVKQVDPPLTQYHLEAVVKHPKLFPNSRGEERSGPLTDDQKLGYMREYTLYHNVVMELVAMSAASFSVSLSECAGGGQQIRVWKTLIRYIYKHNWYINRETLASRPLCLALDEANSSFPDPYSTSLDDTDVQDARDSAKICPNEMTNFSGGYVLSPKIGFYSSPVWTFDFSSMYPTVIIGHLLCFSTIIFDEIYIRDKTVSKIFVPLTTDKCVAFATHVDGIPVRTLLPQLTAESMQKRKDIKAKIAQETDPSLIQVLKTQELTIKVSNNAIYGFLGMGKGGKLPLPEIAGAVTSIGRNMNRMTCSALEKKGCQVVYGDTDSCMAILPTPFAQPVEALEDMKTKAFQWAAECTRLFPAPITLAVESFKAPFYITNKKVYAAYEYPAGNYNVTPKLTLKGLLIIKRTTCLWIQVLGRRIFECILGGNLQLISPLLQSACLKLRTGKVGYVELAVSRLLKERKEYASESLIQLTVANKLQQRGTPPPAGSRISYVILAGKTPQFQRGEDTTFAATHQLPLDYMYYFEKQLQQILQPTLIHFFPDIEFTFNRLKGDLLRNIHRSNDIRTMFPPSS